MAATGYTPISLYYSTTASTAPSASNLVAGELALNTLDEKLYFKNSSGTVKLLASNAASSGTVSSVAQSFTGGLISVTGSPITTSGTLALTVAGTSGGIPYFSSGTAWASSAALAANSIVLGGGAGVAPATTTTGTGVVTALGVNTGTAGAFVVNGGVLGTPSSGTVTNLTGTASININGSVGATTASTGAFTTVSASGAITSTVTTGTAPFTVASTTQVANLNAATAGTAGNVTGTVAVANGGTGLTTTPANGALNIGNGTGFTRTTLTAGSNITITNGAGSITIAASGGITSGTVVASTSGTSIDFTSIPATVKRITVMLNQVSNSGTSNPIIQLGTSGGIQNTGYRGLAAYITGSGAQTATQITTGLVIWNFNNSSGSIGQGSLILTLLDAANGIWTMQSCTARSDTNWVNYAAGSKTLSGTLDRVRITTANGTDTFTAGSINILYE